MKEHFNEKYLESEKYPKAIFKGKINGFKNSGKEELTAEGDMTIHGVTKYIKVQGTITTQKKELHLATTFTVRLEDYEVQIPKLLWQNIAEEVEVKILFIYKPL